MTATLLRHELRRGAPSWAVWTLSLAGLAAACVALYPQMETDMADMGALFASMGAFTAAFGMDRLDIGSFIGFYGVECGSIITLGGAFYAAMTAAAALAGEERAGTAEFLLTHPLGRRRVLAAKGTAVTVQLLALNAVAFAAVTVTAAAIGQRIPWRDLLFLHAAWLLLQLQLAALCFGLSAVLRGGEAGVGLGLAAGLYFLALLANIAPAARWLRYLTPFSCAEAARLLTDGFDLGLALPGLAASLLIAAAGCRWYTQKDIIA